MPGTRDIILNRTNIANVPKIFIVWWEGIIKDVISMVKRYNAWEDPR